MKRLVSSELNRARDLKNRPCCRQNIDTVKALSAIHKGKKLINYPVCDTRTVVAPFRSNGIELVEEKDTWFGRARPFKNVADLGEG